MKLSTSCFLILLAWCSYSCPHQLLIEWDFGFRCCHLGEEGRKGFNEIEESDCDTLAVLAWTASMVNLRPLMIAAGACLQVSGGRSGWRSKGCDVKHTQGMSF